MFVRIKVHTNYCGEWDEGAFEFPDGTTIEHIEEYAAEWADENAVEWSSENVMFFDTLGETDDLEEDEETRESFYDYDILDKTREEVLEEYGEIRNL